MKCRCGCGDEAGYIVESHEYEPEARSRRGALFKEYCCLSAMLYLRDSSADLGFPCVVTALAKETPK